MKICILCTSYPRSKSDYWVPFMHSLARELAMTEDVTVVTSGSPNAKAFEVRDNVRIRRFNYFFPRKLQRLTYTGGMRESFGNELLAKFQAPFFMAAFLLKSLRAAKNCDVINAHWAPAGLVALPLRFFYKKPIVLTEHGGSMRGLPRWLNKFIFKRMDAITSAHNDVIGYIKDMGLDNVFEIRNLLDEAKFLGKHDTNQIKKELKIKGEKIVTFIGRFEELKDPLTFARCVTYAAKKIKNIKFIMIGDGHLKNDIENEIKKLGIEKFVMLPGSTSDVDKFYAVSDIFVACSATENCFSTTILEAMLSKVPCIITKAGMTEKYFVHCRDTYLVDKKNPKLLGESIVELLNDKNLRQKLSKNGLEFLDKYEFRNQAIINKIIKILKNSIIVKATNN